MEGLGATARGGQVANSNALQNLSKKQETAGLYIRSHFCAVLSLSSPVPQAVSETNLAITYTSRKLKGWPDRSGDGHPPGVPAEPHASSTRQRRRLWQPTHGRSRAPGISYCSLQRLLRERGGKPRTRAGLELQRT